MGDIINPLFCTYLDVKLRKRIKEYKKPLELQEQLFQKLKSELKDTEIYDSLGMSKIKSYEEFASNVEVRSYEDYRQLVERQLSGTNSVLYHGKTEYVVLTSGTSGGEGKRIPYNTKMMNLLENFQIENIIWFKHAYPNIKPFPITRFLYGTHTQVGANYNGVPLTYISGLLTFEVPKQLRDTMPKAETLQIQTWDKKVKEVIEETKGRNIRYCCGVPIYLASIFQQCITELGVKTVKEIWPNLEYIVFSGTHIESAKTKLDELVGSKLKYYGNYMCSEAPLGWMCNTSNYVLNLKKVLFSFTSMDDGRTVGINKIEEGKQYSINLSTPNGFLQYSLGDVVEITSLKPFISVRIVGRVNEGMNIVTEKVSLSLINNAIRKLQERINISLDHFFVFPGISSAGVPCYEWVFVHSGSLLHINTDNLSALIDEALMNESAKYKKLRTVERVIGMPNISFLPIEIIKNYFGKNFSKGQFKMPHIFNSKQEFEKLIGEVSLITEK